MAKYNDMSFELASSLFDLVGGRLYWKVKARRDSCEGLEAGHVTPYGYRRFRYKGKNYHSHRVIFTLANGRQPIGDCDHIDRDRLNNDPSNLRELTRQGNATNRSITSSNKSGVVGVYKARGRWNAAVQPMGRFVSLGSFDDFTEAVAHRLAAEQLCSIEVTNSSALRYMERFINRGEHNATC